ncbi:hypothetical protein TWF696_009141 [Orbilia brochopaga]|uniref:Nudix hydrolase domain-containing protein n=1 Tax=Orbilia brochopaga TaxID=3140254 RepID=A0AAV9UE71_9PEZI
MAQIEKTSSDRALQEAAQTAHAQPPPAIITHSYTFDPALEAFNRPLDVILRDNPTREYIAVGAFVLKPIATESPNPAAASTTPPAPEISQSSFPNQPTPQQQHRDVASTATHPHAEPQQRDQRTQQQRQQLLLIRRSASETFPGMYEVPGGGAEPPPIDSTLLDSVARELFEETGLVAKHIVRLINTADLVSSRGKKIHKFHFQVEVQDAERVVLQPAEHDDYRWVGLDELAGKQWQTGQRPQDGHDESAWLAKSVRAALERL